MLCKPNPKAATLREVRITIIQSVGLLILNIKKDTQLTYILSHALINSELLCWLGGDTNDFNDDEFMDYYINFLKSLAKRLESIPI